VGICDRHQRATGPDSLCDRCRTPAADAASSGGSALGAAAVLFTIVATVVVVQQRLAARREARIEAEQVVGGNVQEAVSDSASAPVQFAASSTPALAPRGRAPRLDRLASAKPGPSWRPAAPRAEVSAPPVDETPARGPTRLVAGANGVSPITTNRGRMTSSRGHERARRPATTTPAITSPAAPADAA
jgi:hypothetical protein